MKSIIEIMDYMYADTYYKNYTTKNYEITNGIYDQKRTEFFNKLSPNLQSEFIDLEEAHFQLNCISETQIMQFGFEFCCYLFYEMFLKPKKL